MYLPCQVCQVCSGSNRCQVPCDGYQSAVNHVNQSTDDTGKMKKKKEKKYSKTLVTWLMVQHMYIELDCTSGSVAEEGKRTSSAGQWRFMMREIRCIKKAAHSSSMHKSSNWGLHARTAVPTASRPVYATTTLPVGHLDRARRPLARKNATLLIGWKGGQVLVRHGCAGVDSHKWKRLTYCKDPSLCCFVVYLRHHT